LAACALAAVVGATSAQAADATAEVGVFSKYVWRGIIYNDEAVLQPQVDVSAGGFGVTVWDNIDMTDYNERPDEDTQFRSSEIDLTLYYNHEFESGLSLGIAVAEYMFAHPADAAGTTRDVCLSVSYAGVVEPTLSVYYDFDEVDDFYASFALAWETEVAPDFTIGLEASVGYGGSDYNEYYFGLPVVFEEDDPLADIVNDELGVDDPGFVDASATVTFAYQLTEKVSLALIGQYFAIVDSDLKDTAEILYEDDSGFVAGAKVEWSF
jgi:uncharacterized protein (TIGR02001 family)